MTTIQITISNGKNSSSETFRVEDEYGDMFEDMGMTPAEILEFVRPVDVSFAELDSLNGNHILFGYVESLAQSHQVPKVVQEPGELRFKWEFAEL